MFSFGALRKDLGRSSHLGVVGVCDDIHEKRCDPLGEDLEYKEKEMGISACKGQVDKKPKK